MRKVVLNVNKLKVYDEVAQTTSYAGAKKTEDEGAYERIFTTDDDRTALERFWVEACDAVTEELEPFVVKVSEQPLSNGVDIERDYEIELSLSNRFDTNMIGSIKTGLHSFFVNYIVAMWYMYVNKEESGGYVTMATDALTRVMVKVYRKKKPERMTCGEAQGTVVETEVENGEE